MTTTPTCEGRLTAAEAQGVTAGSLTLAGPIDIMADDRPHAGLEPNAFCRRLGDEIARQIGIAVGLTAVDPEGAHLSRCIRGAAR